MLCADIKGYVGILASGCYPRQEVLAEVLLQFPYGKPKFKAKVSEPDMTFTKEGGLLARVRYPAELTGRDIAGIDGQWDLDHNLALVDGNATGFRARYPRIAASWGNGDSSV
jgi:hypothetical protein